MRFDTLEVKDKTGQTIVLRNAEESDAEDLIKYLRITTGETPFLIREPDEVKLTLEQEKLYLPNSIANKIEDERLREDTLSEISKRIISVEKDMKD